MVDLALILGIYSYVIFALGLLGGLKKEQVVPVTIIFLLVIIRKLFHSISITKYRKIFERGKEAANDKLILGLSVLLGLQIFINFLGAISPELSFDALWYHLTGPKLYVQNHQIFYLPGWLLWPANLPRLTEMFYTVAILFSGEILAKIIHFSFGILSLLALFNLLKRHLSLRTTLLGLVTFYTMLIVGWQSTTAYIDLARTFFEILALDLFLKWYETKKENCLWESAIMVGLAISTKILAFGTLGALGIMILLLRRKNWVKQIILFTGFAVLVISPWLVFSAIHTGNPLFPMFGSFKQPSFNAGGPNGIWLVESISKLPLLLWNATLKPDDIISPIYLIFLPLIFLLVWRTTAPMKLTALYVFLGLFFSPVYSNRYLLPYLPGLTLIVFFLIENHLQKERQAKRFIIFLVIFSALLNLGSRALATRKFLPYLLKRESKDAFLLKHLNFSFGDFYDIDRWFAKNIKKNDLVLVYGIHNLYYVNFPFVHESWAKPGTYFTHILVGNNELLPKKFGNRLLIYENPRTRVRVYVLADKYK